MARTRAKGEQVGDLFAHFGVEVAARPAPAAVVEGLECPTCGWLLRRDGGPSCPLCGAEPAPRSTDSTDSPSSGGTTA